MDILAEVIDKFGVLSHVVVATVESTSPRVRPMTLVRHGASFYFATGSEAEKVKQLDSNPMVEIILQWKEERDNGYIRLDGEAIRETDAETIAILYHRFDYFSKLWKGPDDPTLVVYRVKARSYDYMKPGEWGSVKIEAK
ncbi:pyridoxamine 5'-phosphate oxidase family protein [Candidatus Bathyarchaeota archaeon]|jgi:general stress protein 26|nr:pyridoxamine 5'-phosphate oxidase family protein [Candidatus Bathyarchaeota archaeon]MBT4320114.1 pyridoxamine 5'-phosphate oxidase family protein [Candidatus Bathyarchaeota archaeon]MBT4424044.1 pyridoxamine 5'-phosphate oxidase family protein [Candidatus Bathyarchaeota archaeon]MBT6603544.1 pyridoxamine 5'-phosphate oxidase family protein [Candidatus Bathyarchaeota archaeon]MBT7186434.1 pyridoxamine 5'-phosphate oxidase family protein [Candidatus Bathyarchaeota archaeon]